MGRKRPDRLRADAPRPRPDRAEAPDWMSPRGALAAARLRHERGFPLGLRTTLSQWDEQVRNPIHRVFPTYTDCEPGCCRIVFDVSELRGHVLAVAHVLPPRDARRLRSLIADLESRW